MEIYAFAFAAVSALASAIAAITSLAQARGTTQSNEVQAYLRLMEDYTSPTMRDALLVLGGFWRDCKDRFSDPGEAWAYENASDADKARLIRGHARIISGFFGSAARLFEAGLISRRLFRILIYRPGLNVYYQIVVPINIKRNPNGDTLHYLRILKRVAPQYADGLY